MPFELRSNDFINSLPAFVYLHYQNWFAFIFLRYTEIRKIKPFEIVTDPD